MLPREAADVHLEEAPDVTKVLVKMKIGERWAIWSGSPTKYAFDREDEAIEPANDSEYRLSASVWTHDADQPLRVAKRLQSGTVWINNWAVVYDEFEEGGYRPREARRKMTPTDTAKIADTIEIRQTIENWAVWRDAGDWERFATVWHPDGYMTATWFQGGAADFIAASRAGFEDGVRILHFLGGSSLEIAVDRAVAQTKMTITQRVEVHDVTCDVVCTGRFYDFLTKDEEGTWKIVRRQPIYEQDRIDPVAPSAALTLNKAILEMYPIGYRHLAYAQLEAGFDVKHGLPGLVGSAVEQLYDEGRAWLEGAPTTGSAA